MSSFKNKIFSENHVNIKDFFARRKLKEFPNKADILNASYKKTAHLPHALLLRNKILWQLTSKCTVYTILVLAGSVETQLGVNLQIFVTPL